VATEPPELPPVGEGLAARNVARLPGMAGAGTLSRVGVVLAGALIVVGLAFATRPWGYIMLGFAAGALVAVGTPSAVAGIGPVYAVGRAACPLLVPLIVFVAAGVIKSPWWLQVAVSLLGFVAAWFWLIRPDKRVILKAIRRYPPARSRLRAFLRLGLPAVVVTAALLAIAATVVDALGGGVDTSTSFFAVAVGFLAGAAVLRVVGYANTVLRLPLTIALFVLLAHLGMKVGVVPGWDALEDVETSVLATLVGVALAVAVVGEILTGLALRDAKESGLEPKPERPWSSRIATAVDKPVTGHGVTDRAAAGGVAFAVLSAVLLLLAVYSASRAGGAEEPTTRGVEAEQPAQDHERMSAEALAEMYSPVLLFTGDQRWTPTPVEPFLEGATLQDWEGHRSKAPGVEELPMDCLGVVKSPCYFVISRCDGSKDDVDEHAACAEALPDTNRVYVRVARKEDWAKCEPAKPCVDGSPNPFANAKGDYAGTTEILVQYWYFYPFNEWVAPVAVGDLKQVHPADWEAVTVGLSETKPLWVAYSAHCGGTFADWDTVRMARQQDGRLRPLVAVAHGSQANYRVAEESRVPNFAECSGLPKDRLTLASYAANVRDRTDDATTWDPSPADLDIVTAEDPPMSFTGRWASYNYMRLENLRKEHPLGKDSRGPESPPLQTLWQRPMQKIFGGGVWQEG
jgi:hypothetical protein